MKTCSKCGLEKEESEFYKFRTGLQARCKACVKAYRDANKEKKSAYAKAYRETNKEKMSAEKRVYYKANKEKISAYNKTRFEANRDKILAQNQSQSRKFSSYKCGAKQRNLPFNLTKEEFLSFWQADCSYCGDWIATIGIDRIDSDLGYSLDNCVSCCSTCNRMKMDTDEEAWYSKMLTILKHQGVI